jgi:hypothetical protein
MLKPAVSPACHLWLAVPIISGLSSVQHVIHVLPLPLPTIMSRFCAEALQEAGGEADAREVIRYAHSSTVMPGSSTVCLAVMKPGGRLEVGGGLGKNQGAPSRNM